MKDAQQMPQKKFRYPQELLDVINREAEFNNRSSNGEVIHKLQIAYGLKKKEEERKIEGV
ncbi:Arc family DNA-binding protein [Orbus mooreae]|uniref:Arc family DNA-binding protein n=1 Tax=Orbus mooreae TaxID=3074107 RepID=UPI00370D5673